MNFVTCSSALPKDSVKQAIVLSPIMPVWGEGEFCAPLTKLLNDADYEVIVLDSLSVCSTYDVETSLNEMRQAIQQISNGSPLLLCGFAFGGTLAQCLAPQLPQTTRLLSVFGPGRVTDALQAKLESLISDLKAAQLTPAMKKLHSWLAANGNTPPEIPEISYSDSKHATARMLTGFSLLLQLDSQDHFNAFNGSSLLMVGDKSRMADASTQCSTARSELVSVSNTGMRPWADNPAQANQYITKWISQ